MMQQLPGVSIEGVKVDPFAPTPENCIITEVCRDEWPTREAMAEALDAGRAVIFYYEPEPRAFFGLGRVPGAIALWDVDTERRNFADLDAALRHGFGIIEPLLHDD